MLLTTAVICACLSGEPGKKSADGDVQAVTRKALAALPGEHAFVFTELTDNGPKPLFGVDENERFAIGSSFKLFILGTLAEDVNAGRRQLADVAVLQADWIGPPHSELAEWPLGSPVTLHTLALKMISISDNTATDHLLHLLGRESIERQMAAMGHQHAEWNRPLLSTHDMVMLRDKATGLLGVRYQTLNERGRRQLLDKLSVSPPNYESLDFDTAAYHLAEWYATPMDMARAMAWLKRHTETGAPAHPLRAILTVEPKLPHNPRIWPYVGFKGGSEDQLICGNWLLQHHSGRWYTLHVFWNSPREMVDQKQMLKTLEQILASVQQAIE